MSTGVLQARQLWDVQSTTTPTSASCTPFTLPSGGVISYDDDSIVTLTSNLVFQPQCTQGYVYPGQTDPSSIADLQKPFYSSTIPQTYVVATTTVIAWILVIMLTINPRSFYMGGIGASTNFATGRGLIGGATGAANGPGVGSRPWLQKVATLAVAISMTIATADTLKVAERQYWKGYMDASEMRSEVEGSLEIRIVRIISDIFLWLAQIQTLIRLFPRHKEKVLIKWIGFALIVLDTTFSCLNNFWIDDFYRPRNFVDAIPALSYLFELAVGLLYAAWVMFYGLTKRRYAYYHRRMKSICVVALLSHIAILTPVVFFVTDVSETDVAAWGDYFRWVGSAAASVVVWEWVERIEALEKDEKKDGILGREIFDGDEMLDFSVSDEMTYTRKPRDDYRPLSRTGEGSSKKPKQHVHTISLRQRLKPSKQLKSGRSMPERTTSNPPGQRAITFGDLPRPEPAPTTSNSPATPTQSALPLPRAVSPPSRTDTTSAASTVYVVNYDGAPEVPQPVRRRRENPSGQMTEASGESEQESGDGSMPLPGGRSRWQNAMNPFKRKRMTPPAEVRAAAETHGLSTLKPATRTFHKWDVTARLGAFAAERGERLRESRADKKEEDDEDGPWIVIPAQSRGTAAWSPSMLDKDKKSGVSSQSSTQAGSDSTASTVRDAGASGSEQRDSNGSRQITWGDTTTASSIRQHGGQARSSPTPTTSHRGGAGARSSGSEDRGSASGSYSAEAGPLTAVAGPSSPSTRTQT